MHVDEKFKILKLLHEHKINLFSLGFLFLFGSLI